MTYKINVGDSIPHFKAKDHEGRDHSDEDLKGKFSIVYFYPKDQTPGCTLEACSFRDEMPHFEKINANVFGISPDGADSHANFIKKQNLNFTLLCDEDLKVCRAFDVIHQKEREGKKVDSVERSTFLIDPNGIIRWVERPVKVEGHVQRVLEIVSELKKA